MLLKDLPLADQDAARIAAIIEQHDPLEMRVALMKHGVMIAFAAPLELHVPAPEVAN